MGYYAHITSVEFTIPAENFDKVINAWREMEATPGFLSYPSASIFHDYADALVPPSVATLLERELGFAVVDGDGFVSIDSFEDEKLWNQQEYILAASEFADAGWHVDWEGEDGERWRQQEEGLAIGVTDFEDSSERLAAVKAYVESTLLELLGSDKSNDWTAEAAQLRELLGIEG
jgi:hypothetical protein